MMPPGVLGRLTHPVPEIVLLGNLGLIELGRWTLFVWVDFWGQKNDFVIDVDLPRAGCES